MWKECIQLAILLCGALCCGSFHCDAIDELYRFMIGRNATLTECNHFVNVILSGQQVAYYEPYANQSQSRSGYCTNWGGRTFFGKNETITAYNALNISNRGGDAFVVI